MSIQTILNDAIGDDKKKPRMTTQEKFKEICSYQIESELKDILRERKADKRAILYTAVFGGFFGGFFVGYMVAHVIIYLMR